jgi:hypothetical protein
MRVRAKRPFYVNNDLICANQLLNISASSASLYVARGDAEYTLPEHATQPQYETARAMARKRRKK